MALKQCPNHLEQVQFDFHMKPDSITSRHVWSATLKSLAVGLCVFCLGGVLAGWLTAHNVHGYLAFLDDVVAGLFAGFLVLLYERWRQRAFDNLRESERVLKERTALLQSREDLLKIFVKHVPAAVAMLDRAMGYLQVSDRWCVDFSLDSSQVLGRSHYEIFPDLPDRWKQLHRRALAGETLRAEEDRWDREGGTTWLRWEMRPWQNLDGMPGGILIFSEDITRRRQIEESLSEIPRKLIEAQEQERTRIGRELHDDIGQRLAMLAIELQKNARRPSNFAQSAQPYGRTPEAERGNSRRYSILVT